MGRGDGMVDREKVIKGLQEAVDWLSTETSLTVVDQWVVRDALALLKEQESVEPVRKPEIFDSLYFCGKCLTKVGFQIRKDDSWRFKCNFCPNCGMAVKWE